MHLQAELSCNKVGRVLEISKRGRQVGVTGQAGRRGLPSGRRPERRDLEGPAVPARGGQIPPPAGTRLRRCPPSAQAPWLDGDAAVQSVRRRQPAGLQVHQFCVRYRVFSKAQQRSMRQAHITGEKLFIDYAGDFVPIVDAATCEITRAKIFVVLLPPQTLEDGQGQRRRPRRVRWPRPLLVKVELARCSAGFASTKRRFRQRVAARRRAR